MDLGCSCFKKYYKELVQGCFDFLKVGLQYNFSEGLARRFIYDWLQTPPNFTYGGWLARLLPCLLPCCLPGLLACMQGGCLLWLTCMAGSLPCPLACWLASLLPCFLASLLPCFLAWLACLSAGFIVKG